MNLGSRSCYWSFVLLLTYSYFRCQYQVEDNKDDLPESPQMKNDCPCGLSDWQRDPCLLSQPAWQGRNKPKLTVSRCHSNEPHSSWVTKYSLQEFSLWHLSGPSSVCSMVRPVFSTLASRRPGLERQFWYWVIAKKKICANFLESVKNQA